MKKMRLRLFILPLYVLLAFGCEKNAAPQQEAPPQQPPNTSITNAKFNTAAADSWWKTGGEILSRCLARSRELQSSTTLFLETPNQNTLATAQASWQKARIAYQYFYPFHYLARNNTQAFGLLAEVDFRIAAHPIQPGSLDSFGEYRYAGLVHELGNPLTLDTLERLHGQIDSENATLGLFAIEYLLFSENHSRQASDFSAQTRVDDEFKARGFKSPSELPNNRRRMLLSLQLGKLVDDLELLVNSWNTPAKTSQLNRWQNLTDKQKQYAIFTSLEQGLTQLLLDTNSGKISTDNVHAAVTALQPLPAILELPSASQLEAGFLELQQLLETKHDAEQTLDWRQVETLLAKLSTHLSASANNSDTGTATNIQATKSVE